MSMNTNPVVGKEFGFKNCDGSYMQNGQSNASAQQNATMQPAAAQSTTASAPNGTPSTQSPPGMMQQKCNCKKNNMGQGLLMVLGASLIFFSVGYIFFHKSE